MDPYQSNGVATAAVSHSYDDDHLQNDQGQNTTSWQTTYFPTTALSSDVGNFEPAPLDDPRQQSSGPSEDRLPDSSFQCKTCFEFFSKQHKLTLVSKHPKTEHSLPSTASTRRSIASPYRAISASLGLSEARRRERI
jgi:hypothetical protein